jgi:NADH:ubiquinone oxidoreductase subunit H
MPGGAPVIRFLFFRAATATMALLVALLATIPVFPAWFILAATAGLAVIVAIDDTPQRRPS